MKLFKFKLNNKTIVRTHEENGHIFAHVIWSAKNEAGFFGGGGTYHLVDPTRSEARNKKGKSQLIPLTDAETLDVEAKIKKMKTSPY